MLKHFDRLHKVDILRLEKHIAADRLGKKIRFEVPLDHLGTFLNSKQHKSRSRISENRKSSRESPQV
jgi:hypothetical protein